MEHRPDSEDGFSAQERADYFGAAELANPKQAHFDECRAIVAKRIRYGFTLNERDDGGAFISEALSQTYPLPLPSDSEFVDRLAKALRLDNPIPARPRNMRRTAAQHEREERGESLADNAQQ